MRSPEYFSQFVLEVVSKLDRVVCYEQGGPHHSLVWPEMGEAQWREAALNAVRALDRIGEAKFEEPTPEHDWLFFAVGKGRSRTAH